MNNYFADLSKELETSRREHEAALADYQREFRETLRNISIASGALAVGALVLLGSETRVHESFILIGIILLFIEVLFVTSYLLLVHMGLIRKLKTILDAIDVVAKLFRMGKQSKNLQDKALKEAFKEQAESFKVLRSGLMQKRPDESRNTLFEIFVVLLFFCGIVALIAGLIAPSF